MVKNLTIGLATVALAIASAATSYRLTLFQPSVINGTELKPGEYKVEIKDNTVLIKQGKTVTEAPVKVQTESDKFPTTSVRYNGTQVQEIRVGGTNTRLVFEKPGVATN